MVVRPAAETFEIAGRQVRMPVGVRDALAASATFVVPAAVADLWLPEGLDLVPAGPGRALLMLSAIHYRENDLGEYREISVAFAVRRGLKPGTLIHRLPVDDDFSRAAGVGIWGFPKTVEDLEIKRGSGSVAGRWNHDGGEVLRLEVGAVGSRTMRVQSQRAYTVIDGVLHETRFLMRATGFGVRRGGATVELGTGEAADELRRLGLPKAALFSMSMAHMQARFDAPRPLR